MHRRSLTATVGAVALAFTLTACSSDTPSTRALNDAGPIAVETGEPSEPTAPVETAAPATPVEQPEAAEPTEAASAEPAKPAAPSVDVAAAQRTLADLGYYAGAADGRRGPALRSAVMAFQKVQGLGADGAIGPATLKALEAPKKPSLRGSSPSNRVEVDLTKQVLYVVKGGAIERILPISSGNGATYKQKDGSNARALTPTGYYKIQRRIVGERKADLGTLYDPQYFYKGWAIHGSNSVPAFPASHGCVRVTRADAKYLLTALSNGMTVYLYGGTHTFSAGSSAPGTDSPTGDTGSAPAPAPASASPKPSSAAPAPKPSSAAPAPQPSSAAPAPKPTPTPAAPAPSPSSASPRPTPTASPAP